MPTLLLPPRLTEDSVRLWRASVAANWDTLRLDRWRAPEGLDPAALLPILRPLCPPPPPRLRRQTYS